MTSFIWWGRNSILINAHHQTIAARSCVHFLQLVGTFAPFSRRVDGALGYHGEIHVIGKAYFVRQAAILFRFAQATKDPKISAALMEKAADLKLRVDDPSASGDLTPLAPDNEPPSAT
jgi:hypothetical protein